jgi:hypothetical protein
MVPSGFKQFFQVQSLPEATLRIRGLGVREAMPPGFINRPSGTGDWLFMYFHTPARAAT